MSKTKKDRPERLQERDKRRERHPKPYRRIPSHRDPFGEDEWREDTSSDHPNHLRSSVVVQPSQMAYLSDPSPEELAFQYL